MQITPKIQADLNDRQGDCKWVNDILYLTNGNWMLRIPHMRQRFPTVPFDSLPKAGNWEKIDCRIITAEAFTDEMFLPETSKSYLPILLKAGYGNSSPSPESMNELMEGMLDHCDRVGTYSVSEAFRAGEGIPTYPEREEGVALPIDRAVAYMFELGPRVVGVDGRIFRSFLDMGFEIFVPKEAKRDKDLNIELPPLVCIGDDWVGLIGELKMDVRETRDGRKLPRPSGTMSWYNEADGWDMLDREVQSFRPSPGGDVGFDPDCDFDAERWNYDKIWSIISILRWHGVSDDDIRLALHARRRTAHLQILNDELQRAVNMLAYANRLGGISMANEVRRFESEVKRLCENVETLMQLTGETPDLSNIETLVGAVSTYAARFAT